MTTTEQVIAKYNRVITGKIQRENSWHQVDVTYKDPQADVSEFEKSVSQPLAL